MSQPMSLVLSLAVALSALGCGQRISEQPPAKETRVSATRNVVLIVADALRADRIHAQRGGVPVMPRLARWSKGAWVFSHATSQASWTKPAMVSIFTSLYPDVHNVRFGIDAQFVDGQSAQVDVLPDDLQTMASFLRQHGYATAAVQTNANLKPLFGVDQGFDTYFFQAYPSFRANQVTDKAIELADGLTGPFFLYVHYMDPHAPYEPPAAYRTTFGTLPEISETDREQLADYGTYYQDCVVHALGLQEERKRPELSAAGREYVRWLYDGEARFVDDEVARLLAFVLDRHPNTLVIFTADHGEELWEHGTVGHGKTVYEELIHVPLFMRGPDTPRGTVYRRVETIDLLPTLADYLDLAPKTDWQGQSLLNLTSGNAPAAEPRFVFSETQTSLRIADVYFDAVLCEDHKVIVDEKAQTVQAYDLAVDPGETRGEVPRAWVPDLQGALERQAEANRAHPRHRADSATRELDLDTQEELEAIGYGASSKRSTP